MWEFIFSTVWGWIGTATLVALACLAIAWFIPPLRPYAVAIAGVFLAAATVYTKGSRDRAALEQKRKDEAVKKAREDYAKIDARNDTPDDVAKRLRDGNF